MRRTQWHRVEDPSAPKGHALQAQVRGQVWRAHELPDGRWELQGPSSTLTLGSLEAVRDHVEPRGDMGRRNRRRNGAGLGAFLGSLLGAVAGGVIWPPLGVVGSIAGGAIGGREGAKADRERRGAVGGAVGAAIFGPPGAALGGYIGGRKPDADFRTANPQYTPEEWLQYVLDGMAQRDADVTLDLQIAANDFEGAVNDALEICFEQYPPVGDVAELYDDPTTAYDIYMTLAGEGVGIWDGRWDQYYPRAKSRHWNRMVSCLRKQLDAPYERLESALTEAVDLIQDNPRKRLSKRLARKVNI